MLFDMRDHLTSFQTETLLVTSASAAPTFNDEGIVVPAATTSNSIRAHVQPSGGKDVLRLPEGMRSREVITVWTSVDLVAATEGGAPGDRFTWRGNVYEPQVIKAWVSSGGYCEAVCTRVPYGGS